MDMVLQFGLPIVATAILIGAIYLVAGKRGAPALDEALARRRLLEDWQDFEPDEVWIAADRRAALATDKGSARLGLIFAFGDKLPSRILGPGDVVRAGLEGGRLMVETRDFTRPRFAMTSTGEVTVRPWAERLTKLAA
ncbi:hypothetical protein D3874_03350 [Oleomonas cavernae]|uniref:Uncharacterized protein n=1 Tax=Oleomonas cavernae TaxID=2320859 RepID=A0A418WUB4_9PROT|nr:hypothetical protein [Oleomonas cavernae]RJF94863.1 hypothetical protein D3874_03350 [Oleomonas cavernae]